MNEEKIVAMLSKIVALESGVHPVIAKRLYTTAALHDVGKIVISDDIVHKPGKLTAQEFEIMKTHTTLGVNILASIQGEAGVMARNLCQYHHEFWNGTGYWKKYACELPPYIQIISICDVYTALVSERSYKHAWTPKEAMEYIRSQSGTQFNPQLTEIFLKLTQFDNSIKELFMLLETEG